MGIILDGADSYVSLPSAPLDLITDGILEITFKCYGSNGSHQMLIDRWETKEYGYALFLNSSDGKLAIRYASYQANGIGGNMINDGLEHNIKAVFSNQVLTVYIDDISVFTGNYGTRNASVLDSRTSLGKRIEGGGSLPFKGEIYYARINNGVENVGVYEFKEGNGDVAVDSSPYGNHGIIHNATWTEVEEPTDPGTEGATTFDVRNVIYSQDSFLSDVKQSLYATLSQSFDSRIEVYKDSTFNTDVVQIIYNPSGISSDLLQKIYANEIIKSDLKQTIFNTSSINGNTQQAIFKTDSLSFDVLQKLYSEGVISSTDFNLLVSMYQDSSTGFNTEQQHFSVDGTSNDTKQIIYQTTMTLFDTLQSIFDGGRVGSAMFDTRMVLYAESQKLYDTKQLMYSTGLNEHDLKQAIYQAEQMQGDINLVIYADSSTGFDTEQFIYSEGVTPFDTKQVLFNPDTSLIGEIRLQGDRQLNVYLVGSRELNVKLEGERELNINLKGLI